ncbi:MAG: YhcH/YjgK/YiaL family protein [Oscillospiraceae bacterium]|nr:YhcH/YjgK/YiaL family protein [Oscillospiraceae bacterium]
MIVANLKDAKDYRGIHPMLDKALDYLTPEFLNTVGAEKVHMDGDALFASLNVFETMPKEKLFFESHKRYLDIHVPLCGEERMDIADPADLTLDEEKSRPVGDFYAYSDDTDKIQSIILKPGTFLVAFPADAHRVKGQVSGPSQVNKVVFKILVD